MTLVPVPSPTPHPTPPPPPPPLKVLAYEYRIYHPESPEASATTNSATNSAPHTRSKGNRDL